MQCWRSSLLLLVCLLVSLSCSPSPPKTGLLRIAIEGNPTQLDPRLATDFNSVAIIGALYNGLFKIDRSGEPVPDLALSLERPDERTLHIEIRRGVKFHDGRELTASDVVATYRTMQASSLGSPRLADLKVLQSVEELGTHSVAFRLTRPFSPFLTVLTAKIVPRGTAEPIKEPIGTGPFRFVSFERGVSVRLARFEHYFEGPARISAVEFRIIPDDGTRLLELEKGSVDLIQDPIPHDALDRLRRDPRIEVIVQPGLDFSYIGLNLRDPILGNHLVRQAIAHAINRDEIIERLLLGLGETATGLLAPSHWAYEGNVPRYAYDPPRARMLLDQAGYPDPDGSGTAVRFRLKLKTSTNKLRRRIVQVLQDQLRRVGIACEVRSYEWGTFFDDVKKGNFQMLTLKWTGVTDPDIFHYIFSSESFPPAGANRGYYENSRLDELVRRARMTADRSAQKEIYAEIQRILAEDLPYIPLWYEPDIVAARSRVRGYLPHPSGDFAVLRHAWLEDTVQRRDAGAGHPAARRSGTEGSK